HDLRRLAPLARAWRGGHLEFPAAVVDQVELQLHRADRGQPVLAVALHDAGQRMARVAVIGLAVLAVHPDRQERGRRVEPGHRHEAALGRLEYAVGIAGFEDERAVLDILAPDVEVEDGHRIARAVRHHRVGKADGYALAAGLTVEVGSGHADRAHLGVFSEPVLHHSPDRPECRGPKPPWAGTAKSAW